MHITQHKGAGHSTNHMERTAAHLKNKSQLNSNVKCNDKTTRESEVFKIIIAKCFYSKGWGDGSQDKGKHSAILSTSLTPHTLPVFMVTPSLNSTRLNNAVGVEKREWRGTPAEPAAPSLQGETVFL